MVRINLLDPEVTLKIVIMGPERSGKTAVITYLALNAKKKFRSSLTSYSNLVGKTVFFDHLRISFGKAEGRRIAVDLFSVPGNKVLSSRRKKVFSLADGVIFTLDSSTQGRINNLKAAAEFISWLRADGIKPSRFPVIYLYHKDDLKNRSSLRVFRRLFRLSRAPEIHGSAYEGYGIWETVEAAVKAALSAKGMKLERTFAFKEEIPVTMKEFDDVYKAYYLRKAEFEFDENLSLRKKIIRIDPSTEGFFIALSKAFERQGDHERAHKYYNRAVRQRNAEEGRINIKISEVESKNPINTFERARYLTAARIFMEHREIEKAKRAVKAAVAGAADPFQHLMLMKKLAELKIAGGKHEEALNSFSRLANRFAGAGLHHEALSLFYRVLSARPESLECLLGSGNTLEAMGRFADALAYFKKAQRVMNEGKIVVGRSDVARKINLLTEKITAAQKASGGS